MPESPVLALIDRARRRLRGIGLLGAGAAGAAACAGLLVALSLAGVAAATAVTAAVACGALTTAALGIVNWRRWTAANVAAALESAAGSLDNLVVTSVQVAERPAKIRPFIREAIAAQAMARLSSLDLARVLPAGRALQVFLMAIAGAAALVWTAMRADDTGVGMAGIPAIQARASIERVELVITPPSYARLDVERLVNPATVTVLAGSRVRIAVISSAADVEVGEPGATAAALERGGDRAVELTADRSRVLSLVARTGDHRDERLLSVIVRHDAPPVVRLAAPGKDVLLPSALPLDVRIEGVDDLALQSLALKFTRVSGSGESFTFQEGEAPLEIARLDRRRWTAAGRWAIDALKLEAGDALVYRAVARDSNPAGQEVSSESYLIEIGVASEMAAAAFALPEDDRRYAISQQMVIVKTERLIGERSALTAADHADRARAIGVEQRMVKAEFIFLSGGEVEDEVVEAEQSHELVEGRLENIGRAEMLRAIAAMTRAEERLNQGDAAAALAHERAALLALQRAFDRRRYFLRVTPERARLDASRRLAGPLDDARSWPRVPASAGADPAETRERDLMAALAAGAPDAALAARFAAVDPASAEWQTLAQSLAAGDGPARRRAAAAAMAALRGRAAARLAPAADAPVARDPFAGYLADRARAERRRQ